MAGSAVRVIQGDCGAPSLIEILMRAAGDLFRSFCFLVLLFTLFHRQFHSYGARRALAKKVDDLLKVENHEFTDFSERLLNLIFISWSTLTSHMSSYDIASHEPIHIGMPCGAWRTAEKGRMAYTTFAF